MYTSGPVNSSPVPKNPGRNVYAGWDQSFLRPEHVAPLYLGLERGDAERLATAEGVVAVRVADLDEEPELALTLELKPERLTLLVHRGKVIRAGFF